MEMPNFIYVLPSYEGNESGFYDLDPRDGDKYHHSRVVEALQKENEENCRLLGMSAEREIQLLQKVQQLENQVSCLMQNSESQTQTQIALIKKLDKAKDALNFYAYGQGVDGNIGNRARTTLEEIK